MQDLKNCFLGFEVLMDGLLAKLPSEKSLESCERLEPLRDNFGSGSSMQTSMALLNPVGSSTVLDFLSFHYMSDILYSVHVTCMCA